MFLNMKREFQGPPLLLNCQLQNYIINTYYLEKDQNRDSEESTCALHRFLNGGSKQEI